MLMSREEQTPVNDDNILDKHIDLIFNPNANANATFPLFSTAPIPKVSEMMKETHDHNKHYLPKVVSIGPYHFGNPKFKSVQNLKPVFTMKLLKNNMETLRSLYKKLGDPEMVKELRSFYEPELTSFISTDMEFTNMMVLDSCFILYYAQHIFGRKPEDCPELKRRQIVFIHKDLFLMENQLPYKVLTEVMSLLEFNYSDKFKLFIEGTILVPVTQKTKWYESLLCFRNERKPESTVDREVPNHLLDLLYRNLTKRVLKDPIPLDDLNVPKNIYTYSANDFVDAGIDFRPNGAMSLAHIEFTHRWWWSAALDLPPITVNNCTKPMLLNLTAYEMFSGSNDAWVASYICLLDSLIDSPDDVKLLRKAEVLENVLGSDKEVVKLFRELAIGLAPNDLAYLEAKRKIQVLCKSWRKTIIFELKNEYLKSPWSLIALLGALIALFFSGLQAYYTTWSPKSACDDLCMFLKMNHHL